MGESACLEKITPVEGFPGIFRRTMCHTPEVMLCHFTMTKGARIAMHTHVAAQVGYVLSGRVRFLTGDGGGMLLEAGDSYAFKSNEPHGAEVIEETQVIECFSPMRTEYLA